MISQQTEPEDLWLAERKVARDFRSARLKARVERWSRRLAGWFSGSEPCCENCCEFLACFDEERKPLGKRRGTERDLETVEIDRIVGSVGRCSAFNSRFLPVCSCSKERWTRVGRALREGKLLPPVELYKVGERYFVYDGNHRLSVARYHGVAAVDALVTDLLPNRAR